MLEPMVAAFGESHLAPSPFLHATIFATPKGRPKEVGPPFVYSYLLVKGVNSATLVQGLPLTSLRETNRR